MASAGEVGELIQESADRAVSSIWSYQGGKKEQGEVGERLRSFLAQLIGLSALLGEAREANDNFLLRASLGNNYSEQAASTLEAAAGPDPGGLLADTLAVFRESQRVGVIAHDRGEGVATQLTEAQTALNTLRDIVVGAQKRSDQALRGTGTGLEHLYNGLISIERYTTQAGIPFERALLPEDLAGGQ